MGRHRSRSGSRERSKPKKHKHRKHSLRSRSRDRHQKKSRRRSRSSSISSVSSVESIEDKKPVLDQRLDKLREDKRRQRTVDKQNEGARDTRGERGETNREENAQAALSALRETIPYTNLNSPFNDNNLTATFVWGKKLEVEGKSSLNKKEIERLNRERIHRNVHEMEDLKRNRDARQAAKDDVEMIQRDQERAKNSDWRRLEDTFHMQQAKLRTRLRIKEGRGKASDFLARYCAVADPNVIDGRKHTEFWDDIGTMVKAETKNKNDARRRDAGETVHSSVQDDVTKIFKVRKVLYRLRMNSKTYAELENLERQVVAKIKNAGRGVDVAYWETVLECLRPHMAKTRLKEKHSDDVRRRAARRRSRSARQRSRA
ncbi:hypothetical protein AAVH_43216 [Aphelenchoides avenae]|nr:hypothetical protein AAVH_43216 [Aphelenchus avenae]